MVTLISPLVSYQSSSTDAAETGVVEVLFRTARIALGLHELGHRHSHISEDSFCEPAELIRNEEYASKDGAAHEEFSKRRHGRDVTKPDGGERHKREVKGVKKVVDGWIDLHLAVWEQDRSNSGGGLKEEGKRITRRTRFSSSTSVVVSKRSSSYLGFVQESAGHVEYRKDSHDDFGNSQICR